MNDSLRANQYKIGKTTKDPEERARELSSATGVAQPFRVLYRAYVEDCDRAERMVHARLASYRISGNKEFFEVPLEEAVRIVSSVAQEVGLLPASPEGEQTELGLASSGHKANVDIAHQDHEIDVSISSGPRAVAIKGRRASVVEGDEKQNLRVCSPETRSLYWKLRPLILMRWTAPTTGI